MNSTHQPMKILIRGQTDPQTGEESDTKGVGVGDAMPFALCSMRASRAPLLNWNGSKSRIFG